jgi:hypothetical protein
MGPRRSPAHRRAESGRMQSGGGWRDAVSQSSCSAVVLPAPAAPRWLQAWQSREAGAGGTRPMLSTPHHHIRAGTQRAQCTGDVAALQHIIGRGDLAHRLECIETQCQATCRACARAHISLSLSHTHTHSLSHTYTHTYSLSLSLFPSHSLSLSLSQYLSHHHSLTFSH